MSWALWRQGGEADDVGQEDGDAVERFRLRNLPFLHLKQNQTRQKVGQKFLSFLLFQTVNFNAVVVHFGKSKKNNFFYFFFVEMETVFDLTYFTQITMSKRQEDCWNTFESLFEEQNDKFK